MARIWSRQASAGVPFSKSTRLESLKWKEGQAPYHEQFDRLLEVAGGKYVLETLTDGLAGDRASASAMNFCAAAHQGR